MKKVVEKGHLAILSSCWYLDHISWNIDYKEYYDCDPQVGCGEIHWNIYPTYSDNSNANPFLKKPSPSDEKFYRVITQSIFI